MYSKEIIKTINPLPKSQIKITYFLGKYDVITPEIIPKTILGIPLIPNVIANKAFEPVISYTNNAKANVSIPSPNLVIIFANKSLIYCFSDNNILKLVDFLTFNVLLIFSLTFCPPFFLHINNIL